MKAFLIVLFLIGLFAFVFYVEGQTHDEYQQKAQNYCANHGYVLKNFESTAFDNGPFYIRGKGQHIYKCEIQDNSGNTRYLYIRQANLFGDDDYEFYNNP